MSRCWTLFALYIEPFTDSYLRKVNVQFLTRRYVATLLNWLVMHIDRTASLPAILKDFVAVETDSLLITLASKIPQVS